MLKKAQKKIGIIGYGNMGSAIAERIKDDYEVSVFEKDAAKTKKISGIKVAGSVTELAAAADAIILAIKPQDFDSLLSELKPSFKKQLIISIAAGITTRFIESRLEDARVIRVMPNLPAQIGQGVSGLCKGKLANDQDLDLAWQLLRNIGMAFDFDDEGMIDAVTAVSGSGPAYFCHFIKDKNQAKAKRNEFIQQLTAAAVSIGFDKLQAAHIAEGTVDGTISVLIEKNWSCEELIKRVASKGGTTEAALERLNNGESLENAVQAALRRAKELSKG